MEGTTVRSIAYFAGSAPYTTTSPGGGVFSGVSDFAINDLGQAYVYATVSGGPNGLFYYDGAAWKTVCLIGACKVNGETVSGIRSLRSNVNRVCSILDTTAGNQYVVCFAGTTPTILSSKGDKTSDGTEITFIANYDINRSGDVAVIVNTGLTSPNVFLVTADGYRSEEHTSELQSH